MHVVYWARIAMARNAIRARVEAQPGCRISVVQGLAELLPLLPDADALVLVDAPEPQARQVVDALNAPGCRVRWLHFVSAGREGFEAVGLPRGLPVTSAAGAVAPAVAEHAMALLLGLVRRVPEMVRQGDAAQWDRALAAHAVSLEGMTLAIVGTGHIGIELARRARPFGMRTLGLSRQARPHELLDESWPLTQRAEVLPRADVVALAIALTRETRHLLGRRELAACKAGALLINVARGGVLDQDALVDALHSGHIGGAGLDVTEPEPLPADSPLWRAPNVLISPHYGGGGSSASLERLADGVGRNLRRLRAGEPLVGLVAGG